MSEVEILVPVVPWNPNAINTLAITVNSTMIASREIPGHAGIEDVTRAILHLYEDATPWIHKALKPGG